MPRVTRAALRSREEQEEMDIAACVPLPLTPKLKGRAPLGETSGNSAAAPIILNTSEETMAAAKKGPGKGKKGNATKKATKQKKNQAPEPTVEVIEDDDQSQTSSAAEEACKDLLQGDFISDANHIAVDEERPCTPPSAAVHEASQQLSPKPTTPSYNPDHQVNVTNTLDNSTTDKKDSFVAKLESRTPAKMDNLAGLGITTAEEDEQEDLFVEQIKTRTPGKRISRIEDSVEALDALEEEIEMVGGLIPHTSEAQSSTQTKKQTKQLTIPTSPPANGSVRARENKAAPLEASTTQPTTSARPAVSRPSMQPPAKKITPNMSNATNHKRAATTSKLASTSPTSTRSTQAPLRKRVSSICKAPFQPAKSTKAPTRAVFELPGDAVARKLKEQREERFKGEEEKKPEQPVFKAGSIRLSNAPKVKLNAATKARLSMTKGVSVNPTPTPNGAPRIEPLVRPGSAASVAANKRFSTLSVAKRTTNPPSANSSARVTRAPSLRAAGAIRKSSSSDVSRPAPTGQDLANQKAKGKEVFGRTRVEILERENTRREKDEAVRKARADAAEKGRVASRNWAEKQKLRKMEAAKANGEVGAVGA